MPNLDQNPARGLYWITLPKPHDRYEASSLGEVRSKRTSRNPLGGPPLKRVPLPNATGHIVQLLGGKRSQKVSVHRLIGSLFNGFPKKRGHVYWIDGNHNNNAADNLGFAPSKDAVPNLKPSGHRPKNLAGEHWKPAVGYEGLYEVSNHGRVMRVRPSARRNGYRLLGNKPGRHGYVYVTLTRFGTSASVPVHRLVAEAFIPKSDATADFVDHINDPKSNNCVENLRWSSHAGNMEHAWQEHKDRSKKGLPTKTKRYHPPPPPPNAVWQPVLEWGLNGAYEVSEFGHVKRVKRAKGCRVGRLMALRELPSGYIVVKMRLPGRRNGITKAVHQVVASAFQLPRDDHDEVIHHKNHNKRDNRPENLEWTTKSENSQAAVAAGQFEREGKHVAALISRDKARQIRDLASAMTRHEIADSFGVSVSVVDDVLANRTHRDPSYAPTKAKSAVAKGELHHNTPLTRKLVLKIVDLRRSGRTYEEIRSALKNRVSVGTIGNILNGHTWPETTGIRAVTRGNRDDDWEANLAACEQWCELHGGLDKVKVDEVFGDFPIGRWIDRRRSDHKRLALSAEQVAQLDAMGMIWDPQAHLMDQNLAACRRYAAEHGSLKDVRIDTVVTYPDAGIREFRIGQWIGMQRTRRNKAARVGNKPSARLQSCFDELSRLGVQWNPKRGPRKR